jgi:hypothetical protein
MKIKTILSVLSLVILLGISYADAGTIIVQPGRFDHFTLEAPDKAIAGESFFVKAFVYDLQNNLITNFSESGKEFRVTVTGSAMVQPSHLSPASFRGGTAQISLTDKKAERIVFSIYQVDGSVPLISKEIIIVSNRLDHFIVTAPTQVNAGSAFEAKVLAKDIFDNTVGDTETAGRNIKVTSSGTTSFAMAGTPVPDFRNGTASINLVAEKIGTASVEIQDTAGGGSGRSQNITVLPGPLGYFKLLAPTDAVAGSSFEITLTAFDTFGNPLTDYSSKGNGVTLQSTGSSKMEPSFIKTSEFRHNETTVKVMYEKAEEITIIAREQNRDQQGKSGMIRIAPAAADHFVVITPSNAQSGQPFKLKIEAYDRFNNRVRNYHLSGSNVFLKITGSGTLSPSIIPPSEFVDGVALTEVVYDKAESFTITATSQYAKGVERVAREPRPLERAPEPAVKAERPPVMLPAEKREVKEKPEPRVIVPPKKVQKEAKREEPPKELREKKKKEEPKKVVKKETAQETKKELKKETKREEPKKEAKAEPPKKEAKVEPPKKEAKVEPPKKEAKVEPPKKEAKVEEPKREIKKDGKPSTLNNISLIEAREKAMLVLTLTPHDGGFEYKEGIESRQGKEWLKIRLKPVTRNTEKSMKFKSSFVGDVLVEDDATERGTVNVFIELTPEKVTFDVTQLKNSLIVTVTKP